MFPEYQQTVFEEVSSVLGDRDPTFEDVKNLAFLDMFLKEGNRIHK